MQRHIFKLLLIVFFISFYSFSNGTKDEFINNVNLFVTLEHKNVYFIEGYIPKAWANHVNSNVIIYLSEEDKSYSSFEISVNNTKDLNSEYFSFYLSMSQLKQARISFRYVNKESTAIFDDGFYAAYYIHELM